MWLAGEGGQGSGDFSDIGLDVGGSAGIAAALGVAGVGDTDAEAAFDPFQAGVAEPVHGYAHGPGPVESILDAV